VAAATVFWPSLAGLVFLVLGLVCVRKQFAAASSQDKLSTLGPVFVAAPLAAFGAEHLTSARAMMQMVPAWIPAHLFWTYFVGLALFAAALSLVLGKYVRWSAPLLAALFFIFALTIHLPNVIAHPHDRFRWVVMLRETAFGAGALALAGTAFQEKSPTASKVLIFFGRILFALPILFFGFEHFLHPEFAPGVPLAKLTPAWVPWRFYCADLIGAVLLVAGGALLINRASRIAAASVGLAMAVLTFFLYTPILCMSHGPQSLLVGVNYVADTLLFGGIALFLAAAMPADTDTESPLKPEQIRASPPH
jgi:uncharacterized membrane protein